MKRVKTLANHLTLTFTPTLTSGRHIRQVSTALCRNLCIVFVLQNALCRRPCQRFYTHLELEQELAAVEDEHPRQKPGDERSLGLHHRRRGGDRHQSSKQSIRRHERVETASQDVQTSIRNNRLGALACHVSCADSRCDAATHIVGARDVEFSTHACIGQNANTCTNIKN